MGGWVLQMKVEGLRVWDDRMNQPPLSGPNMHAALVIAIKDPHVSLFILPVEFKRLKQAQGESNSKNPVVKT
jgi:hypothetical protein